MSQEFDNYDYESDYYVETYSEANDYAQTLIKQNSFCYLKDDELTGEREKLIEHTTEFCCLARSDAILVLIHYNWNFEKIQDNWYDNVDLNSFKAGIEQTVSDKIALLKKGIKGDNDVCLVCYTPKDNTFESLKCRHFFCSDCWQEFLAVKTEDILVCLSSTCPQKGCSLVIPESFFLKYLVQKDLKDKFNKAILKNFTGYNPGIKFCPGLSCNICIKCESNIPKDITCICSTVFCFKCGKESHRPCTCEIYSLWEQKSKSNTDDDKWLQANTKKCPHCKQRIEKNQGCNYILCNKAAGGCGKGFCYVCEVDWEKHSQDHFKCNKYTPEVKAKETQAAILKAELDRYKFYFDRFMNYSNAVKFAEKLKPNIISIIDSIMNIKSLPLSELEFLKEALNTVIKSKRTLKNTYVFGFYLKDGNEKKLFEYSQSFLERNSDNLHQLIEQDTLLRIISEESYSSFTRKFTDFKNTIVNLCYATMKYQNNLLNEIENTMLQLLDEGLLYKK